MGLGSRRRPEGNVIEYSYDSAGRLEAIERKPDAAPASHGERVFYVLDGFGHRTREEQQRRDGGAWVVDAATEYEYSTRCHLDRMIQGAGSATESVTEYEYDCNGNLQRVWDANHPSNGGVLPPTTTYQYDQLDRLTSLTQPWAAGGNVVTGYGYDVQDHLSSVTDAEGNTTTYKYSDRDLLTKETSPVSGITSYSYDEHGELTSETDARGVTVIRNVDALDRVTFVNYPGNNLDITYTYDDPTVPFSKGRLTQILRDGHAVDYEYDRFGRTTRDGDLQFVFDKNGNRAEIGYPGGVSALYTFDFADREKTLDVEIPGSGVEPWVTNATYYPSGPLWLLDFANGVQETRLHDQRYFPDQILAAGPSSTLLSWKYTTDDVGNITLIDDLLSPSDRGYGYLDYQYFLTSGNGPWGNLSWSYDKIGNRLSETRGGVTDTYSYVPGASGHNPKLSQISLGSGGTETFSYDAIGSQTQIATASETTDYIYGNDKRLIAIALASGEARTDFAYDGRSFLRSSVPSRPVDIFANGFESGDVSCWSNKVGGPAGGTCPSGPVTEPTYSSEGLLMHLRHDGGTRDQYVFYFAGRPAGILGLETGVASQMLVTSDHLGTPVLVSDENGGAVWGGGFEPFGADFGGAQDVGMFLRFPGQWEDETWGGFRVHQNLYRWYADF